MFKLKGIGSTLVLFVFLSLVGELNAGTVNIFGLPNTALGSATLNVVNGTLIVSNIGPTGADGVSVGLPSTTTEFDVSIPGDRDPSPAPPGSFFRAVTMGTVNGIASQVISTSTVTEVGPGMATLNVNFSMTSEILLARYFLGGNLVGSNQIPNGSLFDVIDGPFRSPDSIDTTFIYCAGMIFVPCGSDISYDWFTDVKVGIPGGGVTLVNQLDVSSPAFSVTSFDGYSYSLTAGLGISSFTITDEQLQTVPEPSSLFLLCSGLTGLVIRRRPLSGRQVRTAVNFPEDILSDI